MRFLLTLSLLGLSACGGTIGGTDAPVDRVVRPRSVTASNLPSATFASSTPWTRLWVADGPALIGSERGLYEVTSTGLVERSDAGVEGVLALSANEALVATAARLLEWRDGVLRDSLLDGPLTSQDRLLATVGDELWFGRGSALLRLRGTTLTRVMLPGAPLAVHVGRSSAVLETEGGGHLFVKLGEVLEVQALDEELPGLHAAVPFEDEVLALDTSNRLVRRVRLESGFAWRRVALTMDAADPGAEGIDFVRAEPGGAAVAGSSTTLYRLQGEFVTFQTLASPLRNAHAGDGLLWGLTNDGAVRIGVSDPVKFSPRLATLASVHCERCHGPSRQAAHIPLATADDWRLRIDAILLAITPVNGAARMPADSVTTLGADDLSLIARWKEEGLQ